eukprot:GHUV01021756.1.p1 GENE.GHUV01021756.1~~GHUV01021756.1.p1  ORF type:complete len:118 (+),score=20.62 GHUV01021756.1:1198-1551(+)
MLQHVPLSMRASPRAYVALSSTISSRAPRRVHAVARMQDPALGGPVRAIDVARTTYGPWKVLPGNSTTTERKYPALQRVAWTVSKQQVRQFVESKIGDVMLKWDPRPRESTYCQLWL